MRVRVRELGEVTVDADHWHPAGRKAESKRGEHYTEKERANELCNCFATKKKVESITVHLS